MKTVRIIKQGRNETGTQASHGEIPGETTREMVRTVKSWVAELRQRRRDEELASSVFKKLQVTL